MAENLYLLRFDNRNAHSVVLVLFNGDDSCSTLLNNRKDSDMAQELGEEYLAEINENQIISDEKPCDFCASREKCKKAFDFLPLEQERAQEILTLVSEEHGERIESYMEVED